MLRSPVCDIDDVTVDGSMSSTLLPVTAGLQLTIDARREAIRTETTNISTQILKQASQSYKLMEFGGSRDTVHSLEECMGYSMHWQTGRKLLRTLPGKTYSGVAHPAPAVTASSLVQKTIQRGYSSNYSYLPIRKYVLVGDLSSP